MATTAGAGNNGAFWVPTRPGQAPLMVIASDGEGWEHVSASLPARCPTWEEMCSLVALFWDAEDCVMQLHPPRSAWVNNSPYCLHLWRPMQQEIPQPAPWLVGIKEIGVLGS